MRRSGRGVVFDFAELSDAGLDPAKQVNEDAAASLETRVGTLLVVCDGMGGHAGGREASHAAIRTIVEHMASAGPGETPSSVLGAAVAAAGRAVYAVGAASMTHARPGSTCVAAVLHERGVDVAHVGDSRLYMLRSGGIHRLTRDHSMVQQMVDAGMIRAEEAASHPDSNMITRALGMTPEVDVDLRPAPVPLYPGDVLLLATDGLTDLVTDAEINDVARRGLATSVERASADLVAIANARGGHDNITVQLAVIESVAPDTVVQTPSYAEEAAPGTRAPGTQPLGAPERERLQQQFKGTQPLGTVPAQTIPQAMQPQAPYPTVPGAMAPAATPVAWTPQAAPGPTLVETARAAPVPQYGTVTPWATGPTPARSTLGRWLIVGAVLLVLLILGAIFAWWLFWTLRSRGQL